MIVEVRRAVQERFNAEFEVGDALQFSGLVRVICRGGGRSLRRRLLDEFLNETLFTSLRQVRLVLETSGATTTTCGLIRDLRRKPFTAIGPKALRSLRAQRLGPLLQLCRMANSQRTG
jgi:hypothetical protein